MAGERAPPRHRRSRGCCARDGVVPGLLGGEIQPHCRRATPPRTRWRPPACEIQLQSVATESPDHPEHGRKVQARRSSKLNLEEAGKKPCSVNLEEALCFVNCAGASNLGKLWLYRNEKNSAKCMAWKLSLECTDVIANCIHCNLSLESTECCIAL